MSKIFSFVLILTALAASFAEVEVSTKLSVLENGTTVLRLDGRPKTVLTTVLPDDDGFSNWGDLVQDNRQSEDKLLKRHLLVYPNVSPNQTNLGVTFHFKNIQSITAVRSLNIGRQRAFTDEISRTSDEVEIYLILPPGRDPRVLIEVYGYP